MAETELYEAKADVTSFGEKAYITGLLISTGVNRYAHASLSYPPPDAKTADKESVGLTSADVMAALGEMQGKAFEARSEPDSNIALKVTGSTGTKVNVRLNGFGLSPSYAFSPFSVTIGATILDEFAALDTARFSIYGSTWQDNKAKQYNTYGKTLKECGWDVPKCLYSMIEGMVEHYSQSSAFNTDTTPNLDKQTKEAQHALNKKVLPILEKLCNNSTKFGWKEVFSSMDDGSLQSNIDTAVRTCLARHLASSAGSFLTTLLDICEEFQCVLVCSPGNDGLQYDMRSKQEAMRSPEELELPIAALTATAAAGAGIFPTRFVAVTRQGPTDNITESSVQFSAYPKKNMEEGGTALPVAPPGWMSCIQIEAGSVDPAGKPKKRNGCRKVKSDEIRDEIETSRKAINEAAQAIMNEWAKCCYMWNALGTSEVMVQAPLVVEVVAGKRYSVKNAAGAKLFTGFAAEVNYVLETGSGTRNTATANITFTHVEFGSFKLPEE